MSPVWKWRIRCWLTWLPEMLSLLPKIRNRRDAVNWLVTFWVPRPAYVAYHNWKYR